MEPRQITVLLEQAEVQRRLGNHRGATELAQRALTLDPDHAQAHAALAAILLDARRLIGAGIEARAALALDADDRYIHRVMAAVLIAERKLDDAWAHCLIAIQGPAPAPEALVQGAHVRELQDERANARELLHEALAIDPAHVGALTRLARPHLAAGTIDLARGDAASATSHARFVLNLDATDRDALTLWAAIQADRSWLLGAWWRWNLWMAQRDDRRQIALLIAAFVVVRIAIIVTDELGFAGVSSLLHFGWLGLCAYTWFAPELFRRMIARSLETVRLDPDF
jgi:Flp pilus assembly protein TadD